MSNQNAINLLRAQYTLSSEWLQGTMQGTTAEIVHHQPGGTANTIAGVLGHAVAGLDGMLVGGVAGQTPLMASTFAGKTGLSELPPQGRDWAEWGNRVQINLPVFHEYTVAVFAAIDSYLATIHDDELAREVVFPFGTQTVGWAFNIMLLNNFSHSGEIACIKGLHGVKGYPA